MTDPKTIPVVEKQPKHQPSAPRIGPTGITGPKSAPAPTKTKKANCVTARLTATVNGVEKKFAYVYKNAKWYAV